VNPVRSGRKQRQQIPSCVAVNPVTFKPEDTLSGAKNPASIEVRLEYLVLARKFRPQRFDEVTGQEHVVRTLANAISQGRIGHAFLFSGPRGVGKTSIARILAKSLNCETGPTDTPCNVCSNCREITEGTSMDVREIDGASNRGIDEIRELRENVKFAPAVSRYKIFIIDEVHMLTREAFNALLKTLEEPPDHVIFIFATTENNKVPATILSRCQCYDFRRISVQQIADNLANVAKQEGIAVSRTALGWIAEAGDGSMRDAQSIFDQVISYAGLDMSDADVEAVLGLADRRFLLDLSEAVLNRDAAACLTLLNEAYLAGIDMKHFYGMLLKHFRNLLLVKIAPNASAFDIATEQAEKLGPQVKTVTRETLQRYLDILLSEADSLRRSPDARIKLETILVRMTYLEPVLPVDEMLASLEALTRRLEATPSSGTAPSRPSTPEARPDAAPVAQNPPAASSAQARFSTGAGNPIDFKHFVKRENPLLGAKLDAATVSGPENGCLTLHFPAGYIFFDSITETSQKAELERLANLCWGQSIQVRFATSNARPQENGANTRKGAPINEIKREAIKSPLLQKVLDAFEGAELVEIKPISDKKSIP